MLNKVVRINKLCELVVAKNVCAVVEVFGNPNFAATPCHVLAWLKFALTLKVSPWGDKGEILDR